MIRILTLSALAAVLAAPAVRAQQAPGGTDAGDRPAAPAAQDAAEKDLGITAPTPGREPRTELSTTPRKPAAGRGRQDATGAATETPAAGRDRAGRPVAPAGDVDVTVAPRGRLEATTPAAAVNDALFAEAAAVSGLAELAMSQIGVERAVDPELREFSQQMIEEHTRLNRDLAAVASQVGYELPTAVDARARFLAESLRGEASPKFNACYAKAQLNAHQEAVSLFEAEAERGQEPHMKAMAAKALPQLKAHLAMIQPLAAKYERLMQEAEARPAPAR